MIHELVEKIRQNLTAIQERIDRAASSAGRNSSTVRLVVVTKAQPVEVVQAAVEAGAALLGENYPEESLPKIQALKTTLNLEWHMIGHLQSRKAAIVADHFEMLHSLDSLRLAQKLDRLLVERGRKLNVLMEFNVSGEASKFGWSAWDEGKWDSLLPEVETVLQQPGLSVRGLMTMPPLYDDPRKSREFFSRLRRLGEFFAQRFGTEFFQELSMGTSADFEAAVQEGATLVRIGTAVVGPRPPKP